MGGEIKKICSCQMSLTPHTNLGGGIFHYHCLKQMADKGVKIEIPLAFNIDFEPHDNFNVLTVPLRRTFKLGSLLSNIVFFISMMWLWLIKKKRFSLLRISDPFYIGPAALLANKFFSLPTVGYIFHLEKEEKLKNRIAGWVCRKLDAVIVTSEFTKRQICDQFRLDADKVHVTYGGVTRFVSEKAKDSVKDEYGIGDKTVLTFLGALTERKNPFGLLEIFSKVDAKCSNAFLLVCGGSSKGSDIFERLQARAKELGIENRVRFTGRISNEQKADVYRATDIFVFPSHLEGFGLSVVEAMAEGAPAVVSKRGSLPEVVEDSVTGFVRDPEDRDDFAEAVCRLIDDGKLRDKLGRNAKRKVTRLFTWEKCAADTIEIHRQLIEQAHTNNLGVFLNTGDGLEVMEKEGQKNRFLQYYIPAWQKRFDGIKIVSYGPDSVTIGNNVKFLPKNSKSRGLVYSFKAPFVYRDQIGKCGVLRVMQTQGAVPAVISKFFLQKEFVTTYGYRYGDSMRIKGRPGYGIWLDFLERVSLKMAAAVIVTTPSLESHVAKHTNSEKIHMIPNGVDLKIFSPGKKSDDKKVIVLFVGRLEKHKGLDIVINAISQIRDDNVELWVIGQGQMAENWKGLCESNNIQNRFLGTVPHADIPSFHQKADIFVLPSQFEGHPKALVEAFASGLACIGRMSPGITDVIQDGVTGLIAKGDADSFGAQLVRLISDGELRKKLGINARKYAEENYDLEKLLRAETDLLWRISKGERIG